MSHGHALRARLMKSLERILLEHPLTRDLDPRHVKTLAGCARKCLLPAGKYLWRQGDEANELYLIRSGEVAVGIVIPHEDLLQVETVGRGEVVGWSWFMAPYHLHFDSCALTRVEALVLEGRRLRQLCERDFELRCELLSRIAPIIVRRLEASQKKLIESHQGWISQKLTPSRP